MSEQAQIKLRADPALLVEGERLKLAYIRLSEVLLWDRNPKRHDFSQIAASIARHGFKDPPKFEPKLNHGHGGTVEGNGRFETLRLMKEKDLAMEPVIAEGRVTPRGILEMTDGDWAVPFLFGVDAPSLAAAEAYGVDHNNLTLAGGGFSDGDLQKMWNADQLVQVLRDTQRAEVLPVTWDDLGALELLELADRDNGEGPAASDDKGVDFSRADELLEKWAVRRGDIWGIPSLSYPGQEHRLMCGDSTLAADVADLLAGKQASLCHADPPYGMGKEADGIPNDNLYAQKLDRFQMLWWRIWRPYLLDNGSAYIWGNPEDLWRLWFGYALADDGGGLRDSERLTFRNEVVWGKLTQTGDQFDAIGITSDEMRMYPPATERALFFMIGEQGFNTNQDNYWDGWEPIRSYLAGEVDRLGWGPKEVHNITGVMMFGHWFTKSQWVLIRPEHYYKLREASGSKAFLRAYDKNDADAQAVDVPLGSEHSALAAEHKTLRDVFYSTRAFFDNTHDRLIDVWKYPRVLLDDRWDHPSPKPLPLVERAIKSSAPLGGLVVSPFCGTGTDLVASETTRRLCYTMDIEAKWVAVVLERAVDLGLLPYTIRKGGYE